MFNEDPEKYDREKHCGFGNPIWGEEDLDDLRNDSD